VCDNTADETGSKNKCARCDLTLQDVAGVLC